MAGCHGKHTHLDPGTQKELIPEIAIGKSIYLRFDEEYPRLSMILGPPIGSLQPALPCDRLRNHPTYVTLEIG
jgi:hypothetical protein